MSTLEVSFSASADDVDDVVGTLERRGFPCQPHSGGYLVLHGVTVGRVSSSQQASAVLRAVEGTELLLFVHDDQDRCVASAVRVQESRIVVVMNLSDAPREEVRAAARAVERLLDGLPDPIVAGELAF